MENKIPAREMMIKDRIRFFSLNITPASVRTLIFQICSREFLITTKSVVATNIKNTKPITVTYQFCPIERKASSVILICCALVLPSTCERRSIKSELIFRGFTNNPKSWMMIIRMGGKAKVAKKAVAPAMRKGSLLFSSTKERYIRLPKAAIC